VEGRWWVLERVPKPARCRGNTTARRLSATDEAFSWLFDGNEIVGWGLAYSYQSRNEAPRCKRGRSCLHLSAFRPKLDEFRSQRSSTIAAKSWRDRQQANDPNAPAGEDDQRSADSRAVPSNSGPPAVLRQALGKPQSQLHLRGLIQADRRHSSTSASYGRYSGVARGAP